MWSDWCTSRVVCRICPPSRSLPPCDRLGPFLPRLTGRALPSATYGATQREAEGSAGRRGGDNVGGPHHAASARSRHG
jgi:hypothetical protein